MTVSDTESTMPETVPPSIIALFLRPPVPGQVKTRLARSLGTEAACSLYQAMVADSIHACRSSGIPLALFYSGDTPASLPDEWLQAAHSVYPQSGDSLGDRMAAAFELLFSHGARQIILIGSDIPDMNASLLQAAATALENNDIALAPAADGGYGLIAASRARFTHRIFCDIPWSTSRVLELTLAACRSAGRSCILLDELRDIDTRSDLEAYLAHPCPTAIHTNAWLAANPLP